MNASGEFLEPASHSTLFGLPVCDLGWNASFSLVEGLMTLRGSKTTLAFLDEATLLRQAVDPGFRSRLNDRLLLPSGGGLFRRLMRGKTATASFSAKTFVPALLTFIEKSSRIAIIGEHPARIEALRDHFARHAPWHTVVALAPGSSLQHHFDLVIVDAKSTAEEQRIEHSIASMSASLVVMAGSGLSQFARTRQVPRNVGQSSPSFA